MKQQIWFTSDHHIGHSNILIFTDRPYKTIEAMEIDYIKRWNSKVGKEDLVYILGDHIWSTVSNVKQKEFNDKLNGSKLLISGNHDKVTIDQAWSRGYVAIIEEVVLRLGKNKIRLSHYPYKYGFWKSLSANLKFLFKHNKWPDETRYRKNPKDDGKWLLHGHTHSPNKVNGRQIHVGVDTWNGYPVSLQQVQQIIDKHNQEKQKQLDNYYQNIGAYLASKQYC